MSTRALTYTSFISLFLLGIVYFVFYRWLDIPLMYFIYSAANGTWIMTLSRYLSLIFAPECWTLTAVLAVAYVFTQTPSPVIAKFMRFGLTLLVTSIIVAILKILLGRYRPEMLMLHGLYGFHFIAFENDMHSTPSGHAAMSFCGFYCIARLIKKPWLTPVFILCALVICYAKLALADHYCSDIILGAYVGIFSVLWMENFLNICLPKWSVHGKAH